MKADSVKQLKRKIHPEAHLLQPTPESIQNFREFSPSTDLGPVQVCLWRVRLQPRTFLHSLCTEKSAVWNSAVPAVSVHPDYPASLQHSLAGEHWRACGRISCCPDIPCTERCIKISLLAGTCGLGFYPVTELIMGPLTSLGCSWKQLLVLCPNILQWERCLCSCSYSTHWSNYTFGNLSLALLTRSLDSSTSTNTWT